MKENKDTRQKLIELIEQSHMAGQFRSGMGVDPSYMDASNYATSKLKEEVFNELESLETELKEVKRERDLFKGLIEETITGMEWDCENKHEHFDKADFEHLGKLKEAIENTKTE